MRDDRYFCTWPECGKSYSKPSKLAEHYRSHTNERCFVCEFEGCGKDFLRKGHLTRHQQTAHLKERPFMCSFEGCTASFALKHHLSRHEKLHADPKPFTCTWPDCTEAFSKHEQLRAHICREHTGQAVYTCDLCDGLEFQDKASYRKHERSVHTGRVYLCGVEGCGETFQKWSLAVLHRKKEHFSNINTAALPTPLMCDECGKGPFKSEASYKQHCRIHVNYNPSILTRHACPLCPDKEFTSRSGLKAHGLAVHSTNLPFVCDQCGKGYGYKKLLKRHIERLHPTEPTAPAERQIDSNFYFKEKDLPCPVKNCNRRFFRQYDLDRHLQSLHYADQ